MSDNPDNKLFRIRRTKNGRWALEEWYTYEGITIEKAEWRVEEYFNYRWKARRSVKRRLKIINTEVEYYP